MKALNKNLVLFMIIVMFAQLISFNCAEATTEFSYTAQAQTLHDLGLYNGISSTTFDPDLGAALNRETGVVMLLRLFGLEADAQALTAADAESALARFTDAALISSWARPYVAYAVQNRLVNGLPDGTFAPNANLAGRAYTTMILRQLGYSVDAVGYNTAPEALEGIGGLTPEQAALYTRQQQLIRDDLVGISFGSLSARNNGGSTVIQQLIADQVVDPEAAIDYGLMEPPAPQPPAAPDPTPSNKGDNDDDDDEDIVTGVTSSLVYEQGAIGSIEQYRMTIGSATGPVSLLFTMTSDDDYYPEINVHHSFSINEGNAESVAAAVYSELSKVDLKCFDTSLEDSVDIVFTAQEKAEDRNLLISLAAVTGPFAEADVIEDSEGAAKIPERAELLITHGAIRSGILRLTINDNYVDVPVQAGDINQEVAENIIKAIEGNVNISHELSTSGYSLLSDGNLIIFQACVVGNPTDLDITLE